MSILSRIAIPLLTSLSLAVPATAAEPYRPSFLKWPSETAPPTAEELERRERDRELQQARDQKTELQKVCQVLLEPFESTRSSLDAETKVAAELLLNYHKAGLDCFSEQSGRDT